MVDFCTIVPVVASPLIWIEWVVFKMTYFVFVDKGKNQHVHTLNWPLDDKIRLFENHAHQ
jgi:hypothetical protein